MTTTDTTTGADLDPTAWCRDRARNYRYYEEHELAMYPSNDHRDASLVEWTIRALGNPDLEDSPRLLAVIAAQHHLELNATGTFDWLKNRINELTAALNQSRTQAATYANEIGALKAELERARTDERNTIAADIEDMPINLGDAGWKHLEQKADEAGYPVEWVRRRRTRDDFTTATIEVAYQYGYRQAAKVARGEAAR